MPSSSASISPKKYEVFISFRGEDTRCDFVSHLHESLCRNKIETYIDYRLEKGDEVWPSLVKAIQESMVFLIVFSENYASSTWCLNELTLILECSKEEGVHAIPVFYKIDPSHIRKQKGSYEIAFRKHEQSNHKEQLHKWRTALTQAANISGWDSTVYRNEAELIRHIVKGVLIKLEPMYQNTHSDGLVGIQEKVAEVELLMHNSSQDVRFIGIWGMGGIGKTTIAKALFNKLFFAFESFCFLGNVREESKKFGIEHVKNKLLSTLLEDMESHKGMTIGGSTYVQRRLGQKKVLAVLDDIDDSEQLETLAGAHHWFGQGSRIIITTRDKGVLGKMVNDTYEVELLNSDQALKLFKMKAFEDNCCDKEFEYLSLKVVDYANGLPLAVAVLGRCLYGKDKDEWESQLEKLTKMPHRKIQQILKLSYDGLDHEEKNIFLFVACFFKKKRVEHIKNLLDVSGYSTTIGLRSLQDKSLLTIYGGDVSMHDLIQEMGMGIVCEESLEDPSKRSRLWDVNDICKMLKVNKGSEAIKSITLDTSQAEDLYLSPQVFSMMPNLLFLEIYNSCSYEKHELHLPQGLGYLSNELRYLHWDNYPLKSLPSTFSAENLVELRMPMSGMRKLWHGVQNMINLKIVDVSHSKHLTELPDFSRAKNLETVCLSNCTSIGEVHPSILSQNKLKSLWLDYCIALTSLKSDIVSRSLVHLSLTGCSNLKEFSVITENMESLRLGMTAINEAPPCIARMIKLQHLDLCSHKIMRHIQCNLFDDLHYLQALHLRDSSNMFEVIDHISLLPSLLTITIEESGIESFPDNIKHFSNLRHLELKKCTRLQSLPPQLPPSLISLYLHDCTRLRSLPHLPLSLRSLIVYNCSSLEKVQVTPTIGEPIQGLYSARFHNCLKLDQHSANAILANVTLKCNKFSSKEFQSCTSFEVSYPGSRVPEWFKDKTTHPCISIDLSSAPLSMSWTLLCCIIAPPFPSREGINVRCQYQIHIDNNDEELYGLTKWSSYFRVYDKNVTCNHVHIWSDNSISQRIHQIKESQVNSNSKFLLQVEFGCYVPDENHRWQILEMNEYGLCPTYSWECQNFVNEMVRKSQASTSQVGPRCSYNNQDDEKESSSNLFSIQEDSDEETFVSSKCQPIQKHKMELTKEGFRNNRCLPCWCL